MTPSTAAVRLLISMGYGGLLGLYYDFLRPLRPKRTILADGLFVLGAFWASVDFGFRICGGDLRTGYLVGAYTGGMLWEWTLGRSWAAYFTDSGK